METVDAEFAETSTPWTFVEPALLATGSEAVVDFVTSPWFGVSIGAMIALAACHGTPGAPACVLLDVFLFAALFAILGVQTAGILDLLKDIHRALQNAKTCADLEAIAQMIAQLIVRLVEAGMTAAALRGIWSGKLNVPPKPSAPNKPLHIDIGGEGRYPNAQNVNPNPGTTATPPQPIPNRIPGRGEKLPYGNRVADGISVESTPISPEMASEIARVLKPGGSVRLCHPVEYAPVAHKRVIDAVGGNVQQWTQNGMTTTVITAPR